MGQVQQNQTARLNFAKEYENISDEYSQRSDCVSAKGRWHCLMICEENITK